MKAFLISLLNLESWIKEKLINTQDKNKFMKQMTFERFFWFMMTFSNPESNSELRGCIVHLWVMQCLTFLDKYIHHHVCLYHQHRCRQSFASFVKTLFFLFTESSTFSFISIFSCFSPFQPFERSDGCHPSSWLFKSSHTLWKSERHEGTAAKEKFDMSQKRRVIWLHNS